MAWIALTCPQCSAPLPRVALWRSVKCAACGSLITKTESVVERATFRRTLERAKKEAASVGGTISCAGQQYRLLKLLGTGDGSGVHLGRSTGVFPFLATLKISTNPIATAGHEKEAAVLNGLRAPLLGAASLYAARCLPEVIACGKVAGDGGRHALVLRHPHGYWGSLAGLAARFPGGVDPRHCVWIWRRMLDSLHFVHSLGWTHGDLRPEHALVNPKDHAIRLIGFGSAHQNADAREKAADLRRSARIILALAGNTASLPAEISSLVGQAADDGDFCSREGARGLDAKLRAASQASFGAPSFVHLDL
ncbi:MAG: protein kinase family protein [Verrucomicrobiaceae bacterium]|nr:MAG: protein kinase family protein [Verrucomicrobiaceae bacterium]